MNPLDTEIRRAMGELADAAPPAPSIETLDRHAAKAMHDAGVDGTAPHWRRLALSAAVVLLAIAVGVLLLRSPAEPSPSVPATAPTLPAVEGISLDTGTIFGVRPGLAVGPDDVLAAMAPRLGDPDADTGWTTAGGEIRPCSELTEFREIRWGDLAFGFWGRGAATYLHYWVVGDPRLVLFSLPAIAVPGDGGRATGLVTDDGVGIGDPASALPETWSAEPVGAVVGDDRFEPGVSVESFRPDAAPVTTLGGSYLGVDGRIVAFGAESFDCGR
jgi:hypothetical protein